MKPKTLLSLLILLVASFALAPEAQAQKSSNKYRPFPAYGFEFKPLKDWSDSAVQDREKQAGVIGKFESIKGVGVKFQNNTRGNVTCDLRVLKIDPRQATTDDTRGGGGSLRGRIGREVQERSSKEYIKMIYGQALREKEFAEVQAEVSSIKSKSVVGKREEYVTFVVFTNAALDMVFDVYTFQMPSYEVVFLWLYPADPKIRKKWSKAVEKSMKTFRFDVEDIETTSIRSVNAESDYDDLVEFHENDVAQTPGWRLVETPSKEYLIKTNSDNKKNINEVIKRLEASRRLFEQDFPPPAPIESISVVRICGSEKDFHLYGGTSGGTAGWFSPGSEELVLYFGENGTASTMSVMTHEAFHQYCHFLFNRSEAHRWFDEGHGDYYGAFKMKGSKLVPEDDMKGGLSRLPLLKTMIREGTYKPLRRHVRFDHGEWQTQGPGNTGCYSQSFGLIYFLREGTRGKVKKKYWKEEYADIIPNYMKYLDEGYKEIYATIKEEAEEQVQLLTDNDGDFELIESAKAAVERPWDFLHLYPQAKNEIWAKAMGESWGKIDEIEFEERWLEYVDDEL